MKSIASNTRLESLAFSKNYLFIVFATSISFGMKIQSNASMVPAAEDLASRHLALAVQKTDSTN